MNLLDLGEDLIRIILSVCISQRAFTSLVCRSFRDILKDGDLRNRIPVDISSVFVNEKCFDYAISNFNIINKLAEVFKPDSLEIIKWRPWAARVSFLTAPTGFLKKFFASEFLEFDNIFNAACKTGRMELLSMCWIDEFKYRKFGLLKEQIHEDSAAVIQTFKIRLAHRLRQVVSSPTSNVLLHLIDFVGRDDPPNTYWQRFFFIITPSLREVFGAAATSSAAYEILEILTELVKSNGHRASGEVVCIVMVMGPSARRRSASAWRWIRDKCGTRTLEDVFDSYRLVKNHSWRVFDMPELPVQSDTGFTTPLTLNMFKTAEVEAYKIIRDGVAEGGFLRETFQKTVGTTLMYSYFVSSTILNEICGPSRGLSAKFLASSANFTRHDAADVLLESVHDLFSQHVQNNGVARSLQTIFFKFVQEFPYESYITVKKIMVAGAPNTLHKTLRFLYVSINECILNGMSRVLEDAINCETILHIRELSDIEMSCLLDSIIVQNKKGSVVVRMLNVFLPFCKVAIHQVSETLSNGQFVEAGKLLKHCTEMQKAELGKQVVCSSLRTCTHAVKLALDNGCFSEGSDYHIEALRILNKSNVQKTKENEKRKLPFKALQRSVRFYG